MLGLENLGQCPIICNSQLCVENSGIKQSLLQGKLHPHLYESGLTSKSVSYHPYLTNQLFCILSLFRPDMTKFYAPCIHGRASLLLSKEVMLFSKFRLICSILAYLVAFLLLRGAQGTSGEFKSFYERRNKCTENL